MNNKMKRLISLLLLLMFSTIGIFTGCGKKDTDKASGKNERAAKIYDFKGNSVKVPVEPKRIVVMNNSIAEILCVLGDADKIVGVLDSTKFPEELSKKEKVGSNNAPNVEKIIQLKPDIVLGYKDGIKEETIQKIKAAGINYIGLDGYKIERLPQDISDMGLMLNKKKKAEDYITFINKYLDLVKKRVEKIEPQKRAIVYWEWPADYQTVSKNSSGGQMVSSSGGINIAADLPTEFPKISNEWILERNPQVIIKGAKYDIPVGYGLTDNKNLVKQRDNILKRSGWDKLDAVKNGNVHIVATEVTTSTRSIVGICYLAKWCYPDLFKDLDPEAVHKELLEKFYKVDYKGIWVCP